MYIYVSNSQSHRLDLRMSNSKRSKVLPRLQTVEEGGVLMSEFPNHDDFNDDEVKLLRDTISISLRKDIHKTRLNPHIKEETVTSNVSTGHWREKLQNSLRSLRFHALVTVLVLLDVFLVLLDLILSGNVLIGECTTDKECNESPLMSNSSTLNSTHMVCLPVTFKKECVESNSVSIIWILNGISLFILFIFIIEIIMKIIAFRLRFFKKFFEVFDAVIVITSFILEFVKTYFTLSKNNSYIKNLQFFDLLIAFRLWRVVRIITGALASYNTAKSQRHKTEVQKIMETENKRYSVLFKEYEYVCDETIRLRELLLSKKMNPFPAGYQLTLFEVQDLGIDAEAYDIIDKPNETYI